MDNKEILNDEQLEQLAEVLAENRSYMSDILDGIITTSKEDAIPEKSYVGIPENTEDKPYPYNVVDKKVIESERYVEIDPRTGKASGVAAPDDVYSRSLTETIFDEKTANIGNSTDSLKSYGLSDEDASKLFTIVTRFRAGEKFNIYHELPNMIQLIVKELNGPNMSTINSTAKNVLDHFIRDMYVDKEFVDLQKALQKELQIPSFSEMYNDNLKSNMEIELPKKADKLEESGFPDKANLLRKVSAAFIDSYSFITIKDALNNNELIRRKISKDLSRYKRIVNEFNLKYEDSKFKIKDIRLIEKTIPEVVKNYNISDDDIKKFIIIICKVCQPMSPNDVGEHTFMYYTIQNILLLKYLDLDISVFGAEILNNLLSTIKLMKEVDEYEHSIHNK